MSFVCVTWNTSYDLFNHRTHFTTYIPGTRVPVYSGRIMRVIIALSLAPRLNFQRLNQRFIRSFVVRIVTTVCMISTCLPAEQYGTFTSSRDLSSPLLSSNMMLITQLQSLKYQSSLSSFDLCSFKTSRALSASSLSSAYSLKI